MGGDYLGIIIQESLSDPGFTQEFRILATRRIHKWTFLLAALHPEEFPRHVQRLQANMATDDTWYAHYFRDEELVVVYRDAVFPVTTDPASWEPAVRHGLAAGVPEKQLDFKPRTRADAEQFFGTTLT